MYEHTLGHIDIKDPNAINRILNSESFSKRNFYSNVIKQWIKYFKKTDFYISYYDDIIEDPGNELKKIFKFVEVDATKFNYKIVNKRINISRKHEMPNWIKHKLIINLKDEIETLADMLEGWPRKWHNALHD